MVYDMTASKPNKYTAECIPGFAIHENLAESEHQYAIYDDDGRGNGNYICGSSDIYWIRRIAYALDNTKAEQFNYHGEPYEPPRLT